MTDSERRDADDSTAGLTPRECALLNERLDLRAAAFRMWSALLTIDEEAMRLLAGRTDSWPLIDAIERGQAAWLQLASQRPDPYQDDDRMLRTSGCVLDARATAAGLSCSHPEHANWPDGPTENASRPPE